MTIAHRGLGFIAATACLLWPPSAWAAAEDVPAARSASIDIAYVTADYPRRQYLSLLETAPEDLGAAGVRVALKEIDLAGGFVGRHFAVQDVRLAAGSSLAAQLRPVLDQTKLLVADLQPADLLQLADMPEAADAIILDMRTSDDSLRQEACRKNVFHILPSLAMRTDAIGQYLIAKHWMKWFVLRGVAERDEIYARDIARTAKRFGGILVEARSYRYDVGSRRVDTGYQQIQTQMPLATRNAPAHDVVFVADTDDAFGAYLPYATAEPRPVVGTQGLVATAWSPAFQEYSALQMQHRFDLAAHRAMQEADYAGWLSVRIFGEAVLRGKSAEPAAIAAFLRSSAFSIAGFKGQAMTFRHWDQQLRQPILLASPLMVVSLSPQEGYLHPKFLTDTLGIDEPESTCRFRG